MKEFNTTAVCVPSKHYMVDISERVAEIEKMVDAGKYFTINRARQYGKTTTLYSLDKSLAVKYDTVYMDFQDLTNESFSDEDRFSRGLADLFCGASESLNSPIDMSLSESGIKGMLDDYEKDHHAGTDTADQFIEDGRLNMRLVLQRFSETYTEVFGPLEDRFKEKDGRELFLLYLKPIINGIGNYYIEAQTRDQTRTDVIVDYLGQQYIVELKIWRGESYNADGERQIREYLDYYGLDTGYMLSFNFNRKKETGLKRSVD